MYISTLILQPASKTKGYPNFAMFHIGQLIPGFIFKNSMHIFAGSPSHLRSPRLPLGTMASCGLDKNHEVFYLDSFRSAVHKVMCDMMADCNWWQVLPEGTGFTCFCILCVSISRNYVRSRLAWNRPLKKPSHMLFQVNFVSRISINSVWECEP